MGLVLEYGVCNTRDDPSELQDLELLRIQGSALMINNNYRYIRGARDYHTHAQNSHSTLAGIIICVSSAHGEAAKAGQSARIRLSYRLADHYNWDLSGLAVC